MLPQYMDENSSGTLNAVDQVLKKAKDPEVRDMVERLYKSFSHVVLSVLPDIREIKGLRAAEGSELIALLAEEALKYDPIAPKRARLQLQGMMAFRKQIEEAGGVYTTAEVANLLATTPGAVRKRLERGRLLAVPFGEKMSFPVWQFDDTGVINHFADIMGMLKTTSPVGVVQFFLTYDEDLGRTPIEALKSGDPAQLDMVKTLAKQSYQQIAR